MNRKERRAARKDGSHESGNGDYGTREGEFDTETFLKVANKFIDLANQQNQAVQATDLHMAFLYAAARYNAYVAKAVLEVDQHEEFVEHMLAQYAEMLRMHLADEKLEKPTG